MLSFTTDELVWATMRERDEEARRVRPHTEAKAIEETPARPPSDGEEWISLTLRRGSLGG